MDQNIFYTYCQGALDNIRYNITQLTERYCDSADDPGQYAESIAPLLKQQLEILNLIKEIVKL